MLVLSRGLGDAIRMQTSDGLITVTVVEVGSEHDGVVSSRIKLGIDAPKSVAIARDDMKKALA